VLLLKLVALIALWAVFFSPAHRVRPTPAGMAAHLVGPATNNEDRF
jgi:hypothetical protein